MSETYIHKYINDPDGEEIDILEDGRPDFPMTRNLKVQPQVTGLETPLVPLGDKNSSQRHNMWATSAPQALIVKGAEFPQVFSGYEREFMKYINNATRFDQPAQILAVIPKYRENVGMHPIKKCPSYLVVYYGEDDGKVHSMWVSTYTKGTNGFGWENKIDTHNMRVNAAIPKDAVLTRTHAEQGSKYCLGVNAATCYGTFPNTSEDAIVISDTLAKKFISTGYREIVVDIDPSTVPLNMYGDDGEYRILPELGQKVRDDGIVCAFRKVDLMTYYTDMTPEALIRPQRLNDDVKVAEPGTTIVDIEVIKNNNRNVVTPSYVFSQLEKYEQATIEFYDQVIKVYNEECIKKNRKPGHTFSNLVTTVGRKLTVTRKSVFGVSRKSYAKFKCKDRPISFMQLRITMKYDIVPSKGSKFTGHYGDKGVISDVIPECHMPINDLGVRSHFLCSSMGITNRMNSAQIYTPFISEVCRVVMNRMRSMDDVLQAYDLMLELFYDLNPEYAKLINRKFTTDPMRIAFARECMQQDYLLVCMPAFVDTANTKWVLELRDKYGIVQTPIEFDQLDRNGKVIRRIRTKNDFFIGMKYVFHLCKVPYCKGANLGYVNDIEVPNNSKDQNIKSQNSISPTNMRLGEDENRCLGTNIGPNLTVRYLTANATSPTAAKQLGYELLTAKNPTQLQFLPKTTQEILQTSNTINALHSIMLVTGVDITNPIASQEEINSFYQPYNT